MLPEISHVAGLKAVLQVSFGNARSLTLARTPHPTLGLNLPAPISIRDQLWEPVSFSDLSTPFSVFHFMVSLFINTSSV